MKQAPKSLGGDGVFLGWSVVGDEEFGLFPDEIETVVGASRIRRTEFAAGRRAARNALAAASIDPRPLLSGSDGIPDWPCGIVGSISHSPDAALAAVGRKVHYRALGLDIETVARVSLSFAETVATGRERHWLSALADPRQGLALIFSAKEAWHKCQFVLTRRVFEFQEVEISFAFESQTFEVSAVGRGPPSEVLRGRFAVDCEHVACLAVLPA